MAEKKAAVGNAADPEQVKKASAKTQQRRDVELNDLRTILATPTGRRFIWRLIGVCAPMKNPFHADVSVMAYHCGLSELGRILLEDSQEASLELFLTMYREALPREEKERMPS